MMKTLFSLLVFFSLGSIAVASAGSTYGVHRLDLVGKRWNQLAPVHFLGFGLPLPWKTQKKYEFRIFEPNFGKYTVTVIEMSSSGNENEDFVVSALDFSTLKEGEFPDQDCFYRDTPACDGRLCDGLLIGVIDQKTISKNGTYLPMEVWKITSKSLKFEKISPKNIICRPQSYAD